MEKTPLRPEEYEELKRMLRSAPFDVEIDGEDIVVRVEHFDGTFEEGPESTSISQVAGVSFQDVIVAYVSLATQTEDNVYDLRASLFALAGMLRESARFVESEAEAVSPQEWRIIDRAYLDSTTTTETPHRNSTEGEDPWPDAEQEV